MNRTEHLLCCLAEEANEVAHRVSKALRFGLAERQAGQYLTNAQRISQEFHDMLAIVELLEEAGVIGRSSDVHAIERKKNKVAAYMDYAERCGTLGAPFQQSCGETAVKFARDNTGTYRDDDEWVDDYGPGVRCPDCGAPDWHPDPSGPNCETWMICESCGLMVDHKGNRV